MGLSFCAGVGSLLEYIIHLRCPWTEEGEKVTSLVKSLLDLLKYSVDLYLIFLVLTVAMGFHLIYKRPNCRDLKKSTVIPVLKFILDMFSKTT